MMLTVAHVKWLSMAAQEAVLTVTDGHTSVAVFCQPCSLQEGDSLTSPLFAFDAHDIERVREDSTFSSPTALAGDVCGTVVDPAANLVRVGGIPVELDVPLPGDIKVGDCVRFKYARLDCLE